MGCSSSKLATTSIDAAAGKAKDSGKRRRQPRFGVGFGRGADPIPGILADGHASHDSACDLSGYPRTAVVVVPLPPDALHEVGCFGDDVKTPSSFSDAVTPAMTPTTANAHESLQPCFRGPVSAGPIGNESKRSLVAAGVDMCIYPRAVGAALLKGSSTAELSAESDDTRSSSGDDASAGDFSESESESEGGRQGERWAKATIKGAEKAKRHVEDRASQAGKGADALQQDVKTSFRPCHEVELFLARNRPLQPTCSEAAHADMLSRVTFQERLMYEGQLSECDDIPHGWGRVSLPEGVVYEGNWLLGRVHGIGALSLPNGNTYCGSWAYGRKHGFGTFVWADGSRHDGYYKAGVKSGQGTIRYASRAVFDGVFENDLRQGIGRLELPNGSWYDGEWEDDVPHGHGIFVDMEGDGERYEGAWVRGIRCGGGRLVQGWANNATEEPEIGHESTSDQGSTEHVAWYAGNFHSGLPYGEGTMSCGQATYCGHVEYGMWTGGGGRVDLGDGNGSFEGLFCNGLPRGGGKWRRNETEAVSDCTFEEGYAQLIWPM